MGGVFGLPLFDLVLISRPSAQAVVAVAVVVVAVCVNAPAGIHHTLHTGAMCGLHLWGCNTECPATAALTKCLAVSPNALLSQ